MLVYSVLYNIEVVFRLYTPFRGILMKKGRPMGLMMNLASLFVWCNEK